MCACAELLCVHPHHSFPTPKHSTYMHARRFSCFLCFFFFMLLAVDGGKIINKSAGAGAYRENERTSEKYTWKSFRIFHIKHTSRARTFPISESIFHVHTRSLPFRNFDEEFLCVRSYANHSRPSCRSLAYDTISDSFFSTPPSKQWVDERRRWKLTLDSRKKCVLLFFVWLTFRSHSFH